MSATRTPDRTTGQGEHTLESTRYFIKGRTYPAADPGLQDALARVYGSPERPRCLCVPGGIEMYIAKHAEYIVKRMPDTGNLHHPTCPSFEPEPGMSGLGELVGEAIIEHAPDQVEVRTDFAMSRLPGKAVPRGDAVIDPAEVHAARKRMSLRALLHLSLIHIWRVHLGRVDHRFATRDGFARQPRHREVRPHLDLIGRVLDDRFADQFAQPRHARFRFERRAGRMVTVPGVGHALDDVFGVPGDVHLNAAGHAQATRPLR